MKNARPQDLTAARVTTRISSQHGSALILAVVLGTIATPTITHAQIDDKNNTSAPGMGLFDRLLKDRKVAADRSSADPRSRLKDGSRMERTNGGQNQRNTEKPVKKTPQESFEGLNGDSSFSPKLQPGLMVSISVFAGDNKEVDEPEKRISSTGTLTLPLVGTLTVKDMTIKEVSALLKARYLEFLKSPIVDVQLVLGTNDETTYPWGYVTVLGRVKNPGRIRIPPTQDLSLSMAVQLAGGFDTSAKFTDIRVTRHAGQNQKRTLEVDLKQIGTDGAGAQDIVLQPRDIVYIPERIL